MEDLRIQDPAKAESMAYAEKPHRELGMAALKAAKALERDAEGNADIRSYTDASQEYREAAGHDLPVGRAEMKRWGNEHLKEAEDAADRAGVNYDSVQEFMSRPLPGSREHLATLPNPPDRQPLPTLPESRGGGDLPPLPGEDASRAA